MLKCLVKLCWVLNNLKLVNFHKKIYLCRIKVMVLRYPQSDTWHCWRVFSSVMNGCLTSVFCTKMLKTCTKEEKIEIEKTYQSVSWGRDPPLPQLDTEIQDFCGHTIHPPCLSGFKSSSQHQHTLTHTQTNTPRHTAFQFPSDIYYTDKHCQSKSPAQSSHGNLCMNASLYVHLVSSWNTLELRCFIAAVRRARRTARVMYIYYTSVRSNNK